MTKTVAEKLQAKPDSVVFFHASEDQRAAVGPLPEGARETMRPEEAGVVVLFARDRAELDVVLGQYLPRIGGAKAPWVVYPKGNRSDINRDSIWTRVGELGWRLNSNVSVDEHWSALRMKPLD